MPTSTPPDDSSTPEVEPLPQPVLLAVEAVAMEAGVDPSDVRILSFAERAWPSTALGCPQPGFSYAQVVTPGYQIILQAGGQEYEFHSNMTSNVVMC